MKRKTKNIVMVLILILSICGMVFTMYYAKNSLSTSSNVQNMNGMQSPMGGGGSTPPEKPDESSDMKTPPDMSNENSLSSDDSTSTSNMQEPPEKPDGDSSNIEMPSGMPDMNNMQSGLKAELTVGYYIAFSALSLVSSLMIVYLIMSRFNSKNCKETFTTSDKVIIYMLFSLILTGTLIFANVYVINNYILNSTNTINNNGEGPGGMSNTSVSYSASKEISSDEEITSGSYSSSTADENAILVTGDANVKLYNITVTKTGDSDSGDATSFYGNNSAILAKDGANLTLENVTVTTNANGANGVFSYGGSATTNNSSSDGTTVTISNSKITTTGDNAGGIMTTGGGITKASNLEINTSGTSSAAIRSDRGGGTVTIDGGTYTTTGQGSPSIYSTADIKVSNATLISKASEGVVIEGANSVTLENCTLTDTNNKLNGQSTTYKNIFLYQSMSGDADSGNAELVAKNSNITTNKGDTLYVTNTTATITLENNSIVNNDNDGNFLRAQKDSWGNSGSNGGNVTLVLTKQNAVGNIVIDSISTLNMKMQNTSYYEGTINGDNTAKSISLKLDKNSKIKLTSDSYITSLEDDDASYGNIDFNGYKLYVNGKSIN